LSNSYQSIPYNHYKLNPTGNINSQKTISIRNLSGTPTNFAHEIEFRREDLSIDFITGVNNISLAPQQSSTSTQNFSSFYFPVLPGNSLIYNVWNVNNTPDSNREND